MQCITRTNRHQTYFSTLKAHVAADNPVRLMEALDDKIELQKLGFVNTVYKKAGPVRFNKIGGKQLRHILYRAALNTKKTNAACKALYDRPWKKGSTKKGPLLPFATNCSSKYLPW